MHKLYPEEYFSQQWLNKQSTINLKFFSHYDKITQKEMLKIMIEAYVKQRMFALLQEEIDLMDNPEVRAKHAKRTRFYLELRQLCKQQGWNVNNILKIFTKTKVE